MSEAGLQRKRRRTAAQWSQLIGKFEGSGLPIATFCREQGISQGSFYRWRSLLAGGAESSATSPIEPATSKPGFIDLGALGSGSALAESTASLNVRLELGAGLIVHLWRA